MQVGGQPRTLLVLIRPYLVTRRYYTTSRGDTRQVTTEPEGGTTSTAYSWFAGPFFIAAYMKQVKEKERKTHTHTRAHGLRCTVTSLRSPHTRPGMTEAAPPAAHAELR